MKIFRYFELGKARVISSSLQIRRLMHKVIETVIWDHLILSLNK